MVKVVSPRDARWVCARIVGPDTAVGGLQMKRSQLGAAVAAAGIIMAMIAGCTSTAYEKQAGALKKASEGLSTARQTYEATYLAATDDDDAREAQANLASANPLVIKTDCIDRASLAMAAARTALRAGQALDDLYKANGPMTNAPNCGVYGKEPPKPEERRKGRSGVPSAPGDDAKQRDEQKKKEDEVRAEIASDQRACYSRLKSSPKIDQGSAEAGSVEERAGHAEQLWAAVDGYVAGLSALSSADAQTKYMESANGARDAIKKIAVGDLIGKEFKPAVDFLFAIMEGAVQQRRYEAMKTAVVCANPLFLRWQPTLRDAMRYQQIAAFSNASEAFGHAADALTGFEAANCNAAKATIACNVRDARAILRDPASTLERRMLATNVIADRNQRLQPILTSARDRAASATAIAKNDPAGAVDAFVEAHSQLRKAIVSGAGQGEALQSALGDLYAKAKALDDALSGAPATAAAPKTKEK